MLPTRNGPVTTVEGIGSTRNGLHPVQKCPCGLGFCLETSDTTVQTESKKPNEGNVSTQDVIFPPELQLNPEYHNRMVKFRSAKYTWYRPITLEELLNLYNKFPDAQLVSGCNTIGYLLRQGDFNSKSSSYAVPTYLNFTACKSAPRRYV
ncbi:xanthine dehydrogenase-like [Argopecten irradians]|uniref:xanthine dehydrogenase-like n=1 Tax=Argopecten irradians TaxID=31199 RepID=UPI00370FF947